MFSQDFKRAVQIYDLLLLSYIFLNNNGGYKPAIEGDFNEHYVDYKEVEELIASFNETHRTQSDFNLLKYSLNNFFKQKELLSRDYFALIIFIDANCPYHYHKSHPLFASSICMETLSDLEPAIMLFPKMEKTFVSCFIKNIKTYEKQKHPSKKEFGLRPKKEYLSACINSKLRRFVFYSEHEQDYIPILHYLTDNNILMDRITAKGVIDIAVFPLVSQPSNEIFELKEDVCTFCINGMQPCVEQMIFRRHQQSMRLCQEAKIDIAVFPEMLLTQQIIDYIPSFENQYPEILVPGTLWKDKRNKSYVFAKNGKSIFEQHKKTPYSYEKNGKMLEEDLALDDKRIHILDIDGVGRIFLYICKDMDNEKLLNMVRSLHGDLVLLPAFSRSLDLLPASEDLASRYHCLTIMANSCSPLNVDLKTEVVEKEIGYITYPAKVNNKRKGLSKKYTFNKSCCKCNDICEGRRIRIKFKDVYEDKTTLSPTIEIHDNVSRLD